MLKTKDVNINRFNDSHKTGAALLLKRKGNTVVDILQLLIEKGLDVNIRYNNSCSSILEDSINSISLNYDGIKLLIKYGADIHAFHSRRQNKDGQPMTLYEDVMKGRDKKIKEIINNIE